MTFVVDGVPNCGGLGISYLRDVEYRGQHRLEIWLVTIVLIIAWGGKREYDYY